MADELTSPSPITDTLCSSSSRSNDEQLAGTATQAKVWFILEHPQVYGAKALEESELPDSVKAHLTALVKTTPGARVQLIKRENSPHLKGISFFVAQTREVQPSIHEFQFAGLEELLNLDILKILEGSGDYTRHLRREPLYLVCTNGKRDPCCAKFGYSFYLSLSNEESGSTWQTSHVGGHRFAANLVCFPHGVFYGRLGDGDVQSVRETYRHGELFLERFRGRSCFPEEVQAAEYFLRTQTGVRRIAAFTLECEKQAGENRWEIVFNEVNTGRRHHLVIAVVPSDFEVLQSCRDLEKSKVMQFHLETYQVSRV